MNRKISNSKSRVNSPLLHLPYDARDHQQNANVDHGQYFGSFPVFFVSFLYTSPLRSFVWGIVFICEIIKVVKREKSFFLKSEKLRNNC